MKKKIFTKQLLSLPVVLALFAGCSSDNALEEIEEPEVIRITLPTYYIPKDSLVGEWELVKDGSSEWLGEKTTVVLNEDGTVVFTRGDDVQYGTYAFPRATCSKRLGASVFDLTSTVKMHSNTIFCQCYLWPDSVRFYDYNLAYCGDHSHLYVRIKEK